MITQGTHRKLFEENWCDSQMALKLTTLLQDHTLSPEVAYEQVKSQNPDRHLSTDMRDQAIRLDKIINDEKFKKQLNNLKTSDSNLNISTLIAGNLSLNYILGSEIWFNLMQKQHDGVPIGPDQLSTLIKPFPELRLRLSGAVESHLKMLSHIPTPPESSASSAINTEILFEQGRRIDLPEC